MQAYITGIALLLGFLPAFSQQADSLSWYLEIAARNNPLVNSNFALYKASLEKIPQAGAYEDPELDIGIFVKPMETLSGKQIADFTLMQMFPWFGTRKAARNEATEMSRMAYEQFREARNNLFYEVKSQWYQLCNLNEQYKNTQANLALLEQLEKLALNRYSAPSANAPASTVTPITGNAVTPPLPMEAVWITWEEWEAAPKQLHKVVRPAIPLCRKWLPVLWEVLWVPAVLQAPCRTYCAYR